MVAAAWARDCPQKRPTTLAHEEGWRRELADAGYDPVHLRQPRIPTHALISTDDLQIQTLASRALDRCSAQASTWTRHTVAEQVTRLVTEYGVRAAPAELRILVALATDLAVGDCMSVLPPGSARPEHVAHLTSLQVIAAEMRLRDLLTARLGTAVGSHIPDVTTWAAERGPTMGRLGPRQLLLRPTRWSRSRALPARERRRCSPSRSALRVRRVAPPGS